MRSMYYHTCQHCGANLDPGERCDCQDSLEKKKQAGRRHLASLHNGHIDLRQSQTLYNVRKEKANECKNQ